MTFIILTRECKYLFSIIIETLRPFCKRIHTSVFILLMDIWGIGYWAVKLARWVKKKLRGEKEPVEEAES